MKYRIVICVLIYFELVASYTYGKEYLEANRPSSERRWRLSNYAQPKNVPPGFYYRNGFAPEITRPYFDNVGAQRASNVPLETGSDLIPVQGQNYNNFLLGNQRKNLPVQQIQPHQPGFRNEFLGNQAKLSQFQAMPHLSSVDGSYLSPVVRQYSPVNHVENIRNAAAFRPQYYPNHQNLPIMNILPSLESNIQKLQKKSLKLLDSNDNVGFVHKNKAQDHPSNLQITNIAENDILQHLLKDPKLREILATTKNKKRYMVIHPNGEVEHLDSIKHISAQHPNHLVINSADIRDNLRQSLFTSSNVSPSRALPLNSDASLSPELPPQYPHQMTSLNIPRPQAIPFKSNASPSSVLPSSTHPLQLTSSNNLQSPVNPLKSNTLSSPSVVLPQVTSSNITRSPTVPQVPNVQSSHVILPSKYPPQPVSSNISQRPTILLVPNAQSSHVVLPSTYPPHPVSSNIAGPQNISLKSNVPLSPAVQLTTVPPYSKNSLVPKSVVVADTPVSLPAIPPTIPKLQTSVSDFTSNVPTSTIVALPPTVPPILQTSISESTPKMSVLASTTVSLPDVPPTIPVLQNSIYESTSKTSVPSFTNPDLRSKKRLADELHLPQQLHFPVPVVSSDAGKAGIRPDKHSMPTLPINATERNISLSSKNAQVISPLLTSPVQFQNVSSISATKNTINDDNNMSSNDSKKNKTFDSTVLYEESSSHAESMTNSFADTIDVPQNSMPLTITEVNPKLVPSIHSSVISSSVSENKSNQTIESNDPDTSVPKPVAMVSPTPVTLSAPIDLADLFPITKEDDEHITKVSNSTVPYTIDQAQSDTTALTTDDGKQTVMDSVANAFIGAVNHEERDENRKKLELTNSVNSSKTTEIQSNAEEGTDPSINQSTTQAISFENAQLESEAVSTDDSSSSDSLPSLKDPSNINDDSSESDVPPIVVDTASATSSLTSSDKSSQQLSGIVAKDESNDGKEDLLNLIESKKNMFWFTPPSYDEIWKKLLGDGAVTMVYFLQMPSQNKYEKEELNANAEHNL